MSDPKEAGRAPGDWTARLRLHPTAFVAPGAVVVGDVTLGARSSVWFNAVLRGDVDRIEVGEDTNIQDGTVVHMDEGSPALIGARVTIGHGAVIHGCVIEDDCLISIAAAVLSRAVIRRGAVVAAGAVVKEGQEIGPGQLAAGIPAVAKRLLTEADKGLVSGAAAVYRELAARHAALTGPPGPTGR